MYLPVREFELLKLICFCKNIPAPAETSQNYVYTLKEISTLEYFGLATISRDGSYARPRPKAYRLMKEAGFDFKADQKLQTNPKVLTRRLTAAQILLTFHRAGISIFGRELAKQIDEPQYIASFAAKQKDNYNPFGNTRFFGIFCTPQEAFLVYYVDDFGVFHNNEMTLFNNFVEITGIEKRAIIMMGKSTQEIAASVLGVKAKKKRKNPFNSNTFAEVFETTTIPVHFVPIGEAGAQVLRFLLIPDYREAIAKAALKEKYKPPYEGLANTDAINYIKPYNPAVVAVDMDVNRIDRAVAGAQNAGFEKIAVFALKEQIPFLKNRYVNAGKADLFSITIDKIKNELSYGIDLYTPSSDLYVTNDGRCFNAADLTIYRKA